MQIRPLTPHPRPAAPGDDAARARAPGVPPLPGLVLLCALAAGAHAMEPAGALIHEESPPEALSIQTPGEGVAVDASGVAGQQSTAAPRQPDADTRGAADLQQPDTRLAADPADASEPPAQALATGLQPSRPDARALPTLDPPTVPEPTEARIPPLPAEPDEVDSNQDTESPTPAVKRPLDIPDAWQDRLHAGLPWEFCGPASGRQGFAAPDLSGPAPDTPVMIEADRVDYRLDAEIIDLRGQVVVTRDGQRLEANRSSYDRRSGWVEAREEVLIEMPGLRVLGDRGTFNPQSQQGTLQSARYRFSGNANLLGTAEEAELLDAQRSRFRDITYSTCPPGSMDWSIRARDLELDRERGMGVARHARLRVGRVPVLYSPYLTFPIDDRRRSGFLIPSFGLSSRTGTDITIPYYWNIAPNMDATIAPRFMGKRGFMLEGQLRHLNRFQQIEANVEFMPEDRRAPDEGARGAARFLQTGRFGANWSSSIDYAWASDETFLQTFGNRLEATSIRNLPRRADLGHVGEDWRLLMRLQQFQTLDELIAPEDRPYAQLPHIELALDPRSLGGLLELDMDAQYDFFHHSDKVHGSRLVTVPALRMPLRRPYGELTPQARLFLTAYSLEDTLAGQDANPSYLIPSLDIDGRLIFERDTDWFGTQSLQTLEPRLYYVLTSFEDQSNVPLFDTTRLDFSFASLFRPNRFTGYDRISDENRLTLGLTSRTIASDSGQEIFRASLGQIHYFQDRRVQLLDQPVEDELSSSVAGEFALRLGARWSALASAQWNPGDTEDPWERRFVQMRYASGTGHLLNLAYRYNFDNQVDRRYEDTDLSFAWPVGERTKFVGRWLYSVLNEQTSEAFAGIEFGQCCWTLRLVGRHLQIGENEATTSIMLQIELAGLGSIGSQIDQFLGRGIYGY